MRARSSTASAAPRRHRPRAMERAARSRSVSSSRSPRRWRWSRASSSSTSRPRPRRRAMVERALPRRPRRRPRAAPRSSTSPTACPRSGRSPTASRSCATARSQRHVAARRGLRRGHRQPDRRPAPRARLPRQAGVAATVGEPAAARRAASAARASTTSSLDVRRGEIVGLAGIAGNGQSEFLRALAGLSASTARQPVGRGQAGVGCAGPRPRATPAWRYLPADRHSEGLLAGAHRAREPAVSRPAASSRPPASSAARAEGRRGGAPAVADSTSGRRRSRPTSRRSPAATSRRSVLAASRCSLAVADARRRADPGRRRRARASRSTGCCAEIADEGIPRLVLSSDAPRARRGCATASSCSRAAASSASCAARRSPRSRSARAIVTATSHRRSRRRRTPRAPVRGPAAPLRPKDDSRRRVVLIVGDRAVRRSTPWSHNELYFTTRSTSPRC